MQPTLARLNKTLVVLDAIAYELMDKRQQKENSPSKFVLLSLLFIKSPLQHSLNRIFK